MRLAVITQSRDRVGGVEAYLEGIVPALARLHAVTFWTASDEVTSRGPIELPPHVPASVLSGTPAEAAARVAAARPDVLFMHGLDDPAVEAALLRVAPAVLVQHTYHGTCISSAKTMAWPTPTACTRPFGPACLAHYLPRRCGGSSPRTMLRLYRTQDARLANVRRADAVMTLSEHMAAELRRNGVDDRSVHVVPPFGSNAAVAVSARIPDGAVRLLYLGRLERLKGVEQLVRATRHVAAALDRSLIVTIAGEGGRRRPLEELAASIATAEPRAQFRFTGWQGSGARARLFAEADALIVPSLWPEPFGLVGLEAGAAGVPAVAFATGGIPEWLHDGVNGCLAPAGGADPRALAAAIVRCVGNAGELARLGAGARTSAARWTIDRHVSALQPILDRVHRAAAERAS